MVVVGGACRKVAQHLEGLPNAHEHGRALLLQVVELRGTARVGMERTNQPGVGLPNLGIARLALDSQHLVVGSLRQALVRFQDDPADILGAEP